MSDQLRQRFEATWRRSDAIFELLAPGALLERPIALRQPLIFYLGHLPAFAWNQVCRGVLRWPSFNPTFDKLFERGIDPVGLDAHREVREQHWPPVGEVLAYRDHVRQALLESADEVAARAGDDMLAAKGRIYHIAIEHELMHQETLLYMVQQLPFAKKVRPRDMPAHRFDGAAPLDCVTIPGGTVTMGAAFERQDFGWDNEFPECRVDVPSFAIDRTAVRNGEFLEFVDAGGYERRACWSDDGWAWKERVGLRYPVFWVRDGSSWRYRTLFEDLPLERTQNWPVYLSWVEAKAFAGWKALDLPTEAEFHRAAYGTPDGGPRTYPWGEALPGPERGNFGFRHWSPTPVGAFPAGASAFGVLDLVGNGWEWTKSTFAPFPGFAAYARTYPGYSADFFDGQHYVMLGASWATDEVLIRRSFRNWFQPLYPYMFAKFRCVARS